MCHFVLTQWMHSLAGFPSPRESALPVHGADFLCPGKGMPPTFCFGHTLVFLFVRWAGTHTGIACRCPLCSPGCGETRPAKHLSVHLCLLLLWLQWGEWLTCVCVCVCVCVHAHAHVCEFKRTIWEAPERFLRRGCRAAGCGINVGLHKFTK